MANIKSAEKRIRTSANRRERNRSVKTRLRSVMKAQRQDGSADSLPKTASEIDRAASKGVIHKKTAARYKSRLAKTAAKKPSK
jgi:small subunit ribosomal protein S20